MILYIVTKQVSGYAREDSSTMSIIGVYHESAPAAKVALVSGGEVSEVVVGEVPPGIAAMINEIYGKQ